MKKYFDFKNKKAQILMIIAIVTLLSLVIGATYAYYIASENLLTTSRTLEVSTNENVSVVATGNTTLSVDLNLDDMRKFGITKTFYATSSGKSETETQEHFMNIVSNSSTNIYCTYTATITKSDVPNYSNMIDQIAASGIENEMVLTFLHGNTVMNTFDMKTAQWNENDQILFTGMITDIEPMGTAELDAKMFIRNLANVDQAPYLALSAVALNVELTKINCDSMDSPRIESITNSATVVGGLDVTMADGGYELASYCIDQVEKSTGECEWITNNDKTFTALPSSEEDGTYYLHVKDIRGYIADSAGFDIVTDNTVTVNDYAYNSAKEPYQLKLTSGIYKLEVWGGQGGGAGTPINANSSAGPGGKGGYSVGTLNLTKADDVYVYVGGQGSPYNMVGNVLLTGGYNGGGNASATNAGDPGSGGGGGTDIRIGSNSTYARVIVAGGGGGGGEDGEAGGVGGGTTGGACSYSTPGGPTTGYFFQGYHSGYEGGSGGGGWYGAVGTYGGNDSNTNPSPSYNSSERNAGGSGGSGYVYTEATASQYPTGGLLNNSHYLIDAQTIAGNTSFTGPTGAAETGHAGHGYARITTLKSIKVTIY